MLHQKVDNQKQTMANLDEHIKRAMKQSGSQQSVPLLTKLKEMNETYELVDRLATEKRNYLRDRLKEVLFNLSYFYIYLLLSDVTA